MEACANRHREDQGCGQKQSLRTRHLVTSLEDMDIGFQRANPPDHTYKYIAMQK